MLLRSLRTHEKSHAISKATHGPRKIRKLDKSVQTGRVWCRQRYETHIHLLVAFNMSIVYIDQILPAISSWLIPINLLTFKVMSLPDVC